MALLCQRVAPNDALRPGCVHLTFGADDSQLEDWFDEVVKGDFISARRNGSIVQYDTSYQEINRWNFINGWPSKWEGASYKANSNEIAVESVTLTIERLEKG